MQDQAYLKGMNKFYFRGRPFSMYAKFSENQHFYVCTYANQRLKNDIFKKMKILRTH